MKITYDTKIENKSNQKYIEDVYRKLKKLLEEELKDFPEINMCLYYGHTNSGWGFKVYIDAEHRFRKNNKNVIAYSSLYKYKNVQEIIDLVKADLNNIYRYKPKKSALLDTQVLSIKNMRYTGNGEILMELTNGELISYKVTDLYDTYNTPVEIQGNQLVLDWICN